MSKSKARWLGSSDEIQEKFLINWYKDDVSTACWELHSKNLLHCSPGDNKANSIYLTEDGLIYMENRFSDKVNMIVDYISKLKP